MYSGTTCDILVCISENHPLTKPWLFCACLSCQQISTIAKGSPIGYVGLSEYEQQMYHQITSLKLLGWIHIVCVSNSYIIPDSVLMHKLDEYFVLSKGTVWKDM